MDIEEENTNSLSVDKKKLRGQIKLVSAKDIQRRQKKTALKVPNSKRVNIQSLPSASSSSQSNKRRKTERKSAKPMSTEKRKELSRNISKLSGKELGGLVNIVQSSVPNSEFDPDEIEIDFRTLKQSTLRGMENYVASCLKKQALKDSAERNGYKGRSNRSRVPP